MARTVILTFKVPSELAERLDDLIARGIFNSRSEALRRALIMLLREYDGVPGEAGEGGARGAKEAEEAA